MSAEDEETLALLAGARQKLQDHLSLIDHDDKKRDGMINTISLIVRTLEKVDHLARVLLNEKKKTEGQLSKEDYEKLREKVKTLIQKAITREQEKTDDNHQG